jgi:hypothetical protein
MKRWIALAALGACFLSLAGCAYRTAVIPPQGLLFTHIKAPLQTNFSETPVGDREGSGSTQYFLVPFFFVSAAWAEAGIEEAAEDGGIENVHYADYEYLSVLGLYRRFTVTAHGI